ncbi:hypothetical protein A7M48_21440 [Acinetobacter baumannii]|nr:hypothetical protein A7M48_21440 [Acinetobacter baumannii]
MGQDEGDGDGEEERRSPRCANLECGPALAGGFKLGHKTFAASWPRLLRLSFLVSGGLINEQRKVRGNQKNRTKL